MTCDASWHARALALALLVSAPLASACLGPNPLLEVGNDSETQAPETTSGDGDGDNETSGDGDGDTETTGDGDDDTETSAGLHCDNGVLDGDETDLDCGGSCPACADGQGCLGPGDCESGVCDAGLCARPTCEDGVENGDELGIDCGGPCTFCDLSGLLSELDNFEGSAAMLPHVEMFGDRRFAVTYDGPMEARVRWFDALGEPLGDHLEISVDVSIEPTFEPTYFVTDSDPDSAVVHVVEAGMDEMSQSADLFLVRRDPDEQLHRARVNAANQIAKHGDIVIDGPRATIAWEVEGEIRLRRYDYTLGDGNWSDINPFIADTVPGVIGRSPYLATNAEGMIALTWVRCEAEGTPCKVVARRFDGEWVDPTPVVVSTDELSYLVFPKIALADDGRAFVAWYNLGIGMSDCQARMLDAAFAPDGPQWTIQAELPAAGHAGVAALADGSFAIAWADPAQSQVHLSRYVGPNALKNPNLVDEAPWGDLADPGSVSAATIDHNLVVVWSATVDMVSQIQGQVLGF